MELVKKVDELKRINEFLKDALFSAMMQGILDERPQNENYVASRMWQALAQQGAKAGLGRVKRIMREHGWLRGCSLGPKGLAEADPAATAQRICRSGISAPTGPSRR